VAEALEQVYSNILDDVSWQIAMHYEQAENRQQALAYVQRAAAVAQRIYAYQEAIRYLRHGIKLTERVATTMENRLRRLEMLTDLASMLIVTKGTASPEVIGVYEQARKLNNQVIATPTSFTLLHGMSSYYRVHAEYAAVLEIANQLLDLAQQSQIPKQLVAAHFELGAMYFVTGELMLARTHLEQSAQLCTVHQSFARPHSILAEVLLLLGYPDQAMRKYREALAHVREHATPFDIVAVLGDTLELRLVAGIREAVDEDIAAFHEFVRKHEYTQRATWVLFLQGFSLVASQGLQMIGQMERGVRSFQETGGRTRLSRFFGLIAEQYFRFGEVERAEATLAEAIRHMERHSERFWEAGLYRLKGEMLLSSANHSLEEAENWLLRALNTARTQRAKLLELRAAVSLSRLWQHQSKQEQAHALLAEVYGWFSEGFDTPDLVEAKALLAQLSR
jgi:tetratricopeptide (TPR) repeat protein